MGGDIMYIGRGERDVRTADIELRGHRLKQVDEFVYLGSVFTRDGKSTQDLEQRRDEATRAYGTMKRKLWGRKNVSLKVKTQIVNAFVLRALLYGALIIQHPTPYLQITLSFQTTNSNL